MTNVTKLYDYKGPENMPEGMDFWVYFNGRVRFGTPFEQINDAMEKYEGTAAIHHDNLFVFAVPSELAASFQTEARHFDWLGQLCLTPHEYDADEYFDASKPVGERYLVGCTI